MKTTIISLAVITFVFWAPSAIAEIPQLINYQGFLTKDNGQPVNDGDYLIRFTIWGHETSTDPGDNLWSSGDRTVEVLNGMFTYNLGESVSLPQDLFATGISRWLGILVDPDVSEYAPRIRLVSSPYAYHAALADVATTALSGGGWTDDGSVVRLTTETDYVGIGTNAPQAILHVGGTPGVDGIMFPDGTLQTTAASTGSDVTVITGSASHNSLITPPAGYTVAQCKCIVSPHTFGPSGSSQEAYRHWCYVTEESGGWRVRAQSQNAHYGGFDNDIANYMVIGVK